MPTAARAAVPAIALVLVVVAIVLAVVTFARPDDGVGGAPSAGPSASQDSSAAPSASSSAAPSRLPSSPTPPPSASSAPSQRPQGQPFDVAWAAVDSVGGSISIRAVAHVDGRWIAAGHDEDLRAAAWYSDDGGATWVAGTVESTITATQYSTLTDITTFGDIVYATGQWGAQQSDQLAWTTWESSDGGATWTEIERTDERHAMPVVTAHGQAIVGIGGSFTGTTPYDSFVGTSRDGVAWTIGEPEAMVYSRIADAVSIGERLVAAGTRWADPECRTASCANNRPAIWISDDAGATWARHDLGTFDDALQGTVSALVTGADGVLVAVGASYTEADAQAISVPTAWISGDGGDTWRVENVGAEGVALGIASTDAGFVAVGTDDLYGQGAPLAWTSGDGILWSTGPAADGAVVGPLAGRGDVVIAVSPYPCAGDVCGPSIVVGTVVLR